MATLRDLLKGTQRHKPERIEIAPDGNNNPILSLDIQPFKYANSVLVTCNQKMSGRWPKGKRFTSESGYYGQTMRFKKGVFNLTNRVGFGDTDIKISKDKCTVRCGCDDYYYMWWWGNKKAKAHEGAKYKRYARKTPAPPEGKPYLNKKNIPGLCKHLVYLSKFLKQKNLAE